MSSTTLRKLQVRSGVTTLACVAALAGAAHAQTRAAPPEPVVTAQPAVASTTPAFTSAFSDYKPYQDQPVGDWKKANDEVGRIGGWRAYTREANEATAPSARRGEPARNDPHAGHAKP